MRLLSVGSLPPEWGGRARGGVATFHAALLEGLERREGDIELVGVLAPTAPRGDSRIPIVARPEGVAAAEFYEDLLRTLEPDAVLLNHVAHTVGVTHARLADTPPAVGVAHSWHNITFRAGEERAKARAVTEEALGGLAALVVPSRHCRWEGERLGLPLPVRSETIHYPLPSIYAEDAVALDAGPERRGVLYVGGLLGRKNPTGLVEAAALLPATELTVVGEGEQEGELRGLIAARGLGDRVRLDPLSGSGHLERLRDLYLDTGALCLPSSSESFGIVFIEALACGAPVVGFAPTVQEIGAAMGVEIGVALEDRSPAGIAAAIRTVLATEWDRAALRRAALDAFPLAEVVERYLCLLRKVAAEI